MTGLEAGVISTAVIGRFSEASRRAKDVRRLTGRELSTDLRSASRCASRACICLSADAAEDPEVEREWGWFSFGVSRGGNARGTVSEADWAVSTNAGADEDGSAVSTPEACSLELVIGESESGACFWNRRYMLCSVAVVLGPKVLGTSCSSGTAGL